MIHYTSTKEIAIILKERSGDMNGCETLGNLWDHWNGGGNDHRGGRAIFQIEGFRELVCEWEEIEDCKAAEHRLLEAFNAKYSVYPVANWRG